MPRPLPQLPYGVAVPPVRSSGRHRSALPVPDRRRTQGAAARIVAASAVLLSGASVLALLGVVPTVASAHPSVAESVAVSGPTRAAEARARQAERAASRGARTALRAGVPGTAAATPARPSATTEPVQAAPASPAAAAGSAAAGAVPAALGAHVGFARPATEGFPTVVVSSPADSGPGTLRAAASGDQPKHVVFAEDMAIRLSAAIEVGSNTVVDGRGRDVVLSAPGESGLVLDGVSNVTITNLTLRDFGNVELTSSNDPYDAIMLSGASDVWIDHNDLSQAGDKLIAVQDGSRRVTVSWNRFHDQDQVFQIGSQATAAANVDQTVTVHHNYFDATGYRNPVVSYGRAHVYNNYYRDWRLYAVRSERAAQVLFERNVLAAGRSVKATQIQPSDDGCNDAGTRCDSRPGALLALENATIAGPALRVEQGGTVFRASDYYTYTAEQPDAQLAERIASGAGPTG